MEELQLAPSQLKSVRLGAYLSKRSGSFPYSFHSRYVVLSGNFLFLYVTDTDAKPRKVVCIDGCSVAATDRFTSSKRPHAFEIKLRNGKGDLILAADSAQDSARWVTAIGNADYSRMYDRTRDAVLFLQNVSRAVAPFAAKRLGIACPLPEENGSIPDRDSNMVPPDAVVAQLTNNSNSNSTGSPASPGNPSAPTSSSSSASSGAGTSTSRAALSSLETYLGWKASLTGTDVLRIIGEMRVALKALEAGGNGVAGAAGAATNEAAAATAADAAAATSASSARRGSLSLGNDALNATATGSSSGEGASDGEPTATSSSPGRGSVGAGPASGSPSSMTAPITEAGLAALQASLAAITLERDQLSQRLQLEKGTVAKLAAELSAAAAVESAAKSEVETLKRTVERLEADNASLGKQVTALKADLAAATAGGAAATAAGAGTVLALEGEVRRLKERVKDLEAQLQASKSAVASANTAGLSTSSSKQLLGAKGSGGSPDGSTNPLAPNSSGNKAAPGSPISGSAGIGALLGGGPSPAPSPASGPAATASAATATAAVVIPAAALGGIEAEKAHESEWLPFLTDAQRLEREGSLADAQQLYAAVLERKAERCGAHSVPVAASHRDLGRVLALQQKFEAAEEAYSRSVEICASLLGEGHPNTACALTDLAAVLREQSKFKEAEGAARRAVTSLKLAVGPNDASTATALYNLAGLAKRLNDVKGAEESYGEALRIFTVALGEGAGETADTLYQMGCLYRKALDYPRAGHYFSRAATSYALAYGQGDKRVSESTKRARAMADKITEGGAASSKRPAVEGSGSSSDVLGGQSTFMSPSVGVSDRLAGGNSNSNLNTGASRTASSRSGGATRK